MKNQDFNLLSCNGCGVVLDRRATKSGIILSMGSSMICPVCKAEISMENGEKQKPSAEPKGFDTYELTAGLQHLNRPDPAVVRGIYMAFLKRVETEHKNRLRQYTSANDQGDPLRREYLRGVLHGYADAEAFLDHELNLLIRGGR